MSNGEIDVLIYVKNMIVNLEKEGFFLPSENPMIEKEIFERYLIKKCNENILSSGDPSIDEDEFISIIQETTKEVLLITVNSLYDKGLVDICGIDNEGNCLYKATDIGMKVAEISEKNIKKKNI